ncbi:MAG: FAD-dependent monooxygenase [Alphaproteobacteria bacterium]|nr:FAD-dependent monooxygenase [Alphaproteobacteria bacterium]
MRIAVIGSGIAGLASATHLSRAGHDVTIFERFETPQPVGAGLLLQPSGLAALETLGLRSEAERRGARVSRLIGRTPKGRPVLDLRYADGKPGDIGIGIHRASLFTLLHDAARDSGAAWRAGSGVAEIADMEGAPRLILETGEETEAFDLAIVSDGAHSQLRHAVCPSTREHLYPWGAVWAIRPDPDGLRDGELDQVYDGCRIMIGLLPVGDNPADPQGRPGVSFFWSLRTDALPAWRAAGLEAFKAEVARYWPRAGAAIADVEDADAFAPAKYRDGVCPTWRRGNTILIGDAAHAMSPQLGQGANLALCDAAALADALRDHAPLTRALPAFEAARSPATTYYTLMSRALTPVFQSGSRVIGWLRDLLMPLGCRLPGIRNWMAWTLAGRGRVPW